uniref:uncharacterized protein LOC109959973 isoform X1 n=1 Tax=Monopterus albus TaxID=43700 RepID=UPI0009B402B7|nr:uncharacterized protein LOC109959973 isoform X1 [Monopterus albus]
MSCGPGLQLSQQVGFSTVSAMYFYPLRLQLHYSVSTALILDFRPDPLMMRIPLRLCVFATLLVCYILLSCAIEHKNQKGGGYQSSDKKTDSNIKMKRNYITVREWRPKALTPRKKMKKTGSERISVGPGSDISCTRLGGICQANRCICQGQYLKDKCSGAKKRQCCMPEVMTSIKQWTWCVMTMVLSTLHSLALWLVQSVNGVKLLNDVHCVKIFNICPYRYMGPVAQGEPLGYLLPLQERFSGITSHLELHIQYVTVLTRHLSYDL